MTIKIENFLSGDCGKEIITPSISVYWNDCGVLIISIMFFFISLDLIFGQGE